MTKAIYFRANATTEDRIGVLCSVYGLTRTQLLETLVSKAYDLTKTTGKLNKWLEGLETQEEKSSTK